MAESATLAKKFSSKKKSKAWTHKKLSECEDAVPQEYAWAVWFYQAFKQTQETPTVGELYEYIITSFSLPEFRYDAYAAQGDQYKQGFNTLWMFFANYCCPIMGFSLCYLDAVGNPLCYTTMPATGLGTGNLNRATENLVKQKVKLEGADYGFRPCNFSFEKEDGTAVSHVAYGPTSIQNTMRHYAADGTTIQKLYAETPQAKVFPFCGIPDYGLVKKYTFGGEDGCRFFCLNSDTNKECMMVLKLGVGAGKEKGSLYLNWADRDHQDPKRLWRGSVKGNLYKALGLCKAWCDDEAETKMIPQEYSDAIKAFEECPQDASSIDHDPAWL